MTRSSLDRFSIDPPLGPRARRVLAELAGEVEGLHRIVVGQPGIRSRWTSCEAGCCLETAPADEADGDPVAWLRLLVREVLRPRAAPAVARAGALGLGAQHRVDGLVIVEWADRQRVVRVRDGTVAGPAVAGGWGPVRPRSTDARAVTARQEQGHHRDGPGGYEPDPAS